MGSKGGVGGRLAVVLHLIDDLRRLVQPLGELVKIAGLVGGDAGNVPHLGQRAPFGLDPQQIGFDAEQFVGREGRRRDAVTLGVLPMDTVVGHLARRPDP